MGYYVNTNKSRTLFRRVRLTLKVIIVAILAPIAYFYLINAPLAALILTKTSQMFGFANFPYLNFVVGGVIVACLAGLFNRTLSLISAYILGTISIAMAVVQHTLFGLNLPSISTEGQLAAQSAQTDGGVVFLLLSFVSTCCVVAALLSARRNFLEVQRHIAKI